VPPVAPPPPPAYSAPAYGAPPPQQPPYPGYPAPGYPAAPKRGMGLWIGLAAAAVVVAAGAGYWFFLRDSGGGNKFDPAKASEYAHGAMIPTGDLPGSDWAITSVDDFTNSDPTGPSCAAVTTQLAVFRNSKNASVAGKASTDYGQGTSDVTVSIEVDIQKNTKSISSDLSSYRQAMQHNDMPKCLESFMTTSGADTAKTTKGSPSTSAPKGGIATAYDLSFTVSGQAQTMRIEDYAWVYSNALVHVAVDGSKDKVTADIVNAAVAKTQAQLEKVASGSFSTPVVPTTGPAPSATSASKSPTTASKSPTATGPTPNAAITAWGQKLCTVVGAFNSASDPVDAASNYPSSMTLDQQKTQFQKDEKAYSDVLAKTITGVQAVQAPSTASKVQDAFLKAIGQIKAAYDIANVQVGLAKTAPDMDAALSSASDALMKAATDFGTVLTAAPTDVQDAVSTCD